MIADAAALPTRLAGHAGKAALTGLGASIHLAKWLKHEITFEDRHPYARRLNRLKG